VRALRELAPLLVILGAGLLTGLVTWLATLPVPPGCHASMTSSGRMHLTHACR
jgi:hypothetical protein